MSYKRNRITAWLSGLGVLLTTLVLVSCTIEIKPLVGPEVGMNSAPPLVEAGPLANTAWYLTALGNTKVAIPALAQSPITLAFGNNGQISGSSGCNTFSGAYTTSENIVTFNGLALAPTACAGQAAARQEAQFLAALQNAASFSRSSERLAIWYGAQGGMLTFTAATTVTPTPLVTPLPAALAEVPVTTTPFPFPTVAAPVPDASIPQPTPVVLPPLATVPLTTDNSSFSAPAPIPITFAPGVTSTELVGTIAQGTTNPYLVQAQQGQTLTVTLTSPNNDVQLRIGGQDGSVLKRAEAGAPTWTGQLPTTQGYLIEAVAVGTVTNYTLQVAYKPLASNSTAERIAWTPGTPATERSGPLAAGTITKQYVLNATARQSLTINLTSDSTPLNLTINSPTGMIWTATMNPASNGYAVNYPLTLPETGDYSVTLAKADQSPAVNYTLRFTLQ